MGGWAASMIDRGCEVEGNRCVVSAASLREETPLHALLLIQRNKTAYAIKHLKRHAVFYRVEKYLRG